MGTNRWISLCEHPNSARRRQKPSDVFNVDGDIRKRLRIASYNINGINSRLPVLTRWLEEFAPDVVGLQELKCTDEAFPREAIEALGYSAIWHGQKSWNGVAILSRVGEPVETRRGLPDDPDPSLSRYIEAAVCGMLIGNMYAPNGNPCPGPSSITSSPGSTSSRFMPRTCSTADCRRS